jgi:hypothetical protein
LLGIFVGGRRDVRAVLRLLLREEPLRQLGEGHRLH